MSVYSAHMALSLFPKSSISPKANELLCRLACRFMDSITAKDKTIALPNAFAEDMDDVRQSLVGDSDAFRRLVDRHQKYVAQLLWRFSRDRRIHEELVQDVFVEAYLSLQTYRGKAPLSHWISRIATRVGYRYWKSRARHDSTETFTLQQWDQLTDETARKSDPDQAAAIIHNFMQQLAPRDRLVLTLRYLEQCDVAQTAKHTGWTKAMVKVQTWRALKRLEKLFAKAEKEIEQ